MRISDWSSDVCLPILADHGAVVAFCRENEIDLVVIGPEQPLVEGLANALAQAGIKAFGPSAKAAQLEGSKGFTKDLCARAGIPTAAYARFDSAERSEEHTSELQSLMRISYAVFCLKKKTQNQPSTKIHTSN